MHTGTEMKDYRLPPDRVPQVVMQTLDQDERAEHVARIKQLLRARNAVLVAHYYADADLQRLADETGGHVSDSLDMARFGNESDARVLVVCGVRFMGETAKILNPEKQVLMPDLGADCSLDIGCPIEEFNAFCADYPDHTVVVYANTSAAVKARADWMVTSGSAVAVVRQLVDRGEQVLWAPDRYLGEYVQAQTGAEMILWQGSCVVHEEFKGRELAELKRQYPHARVLAHPEAPAPVIAQADVVSSTTGIIKAARDLDADVFIVATDRGIFHKMRQAAPRKTFIEAPTAGHGATCKSCGHCPWMAMNSLQKLRGVLETGENEILVDPEVIARARRPIRRLLDFASRRGQIIYGNNDA